ncbi:MAG: lamin tail domain-containing protein, partial [Bacteroidales bacterium]|nr:lamin tail domain-containing protein [Bacteroidales bacterium]
MKFFSLFLYFFPLILTAQIFDDFSDGNFNSNPQWLGDTIEFKISSSSAIPPEQKPGLQLNGTEANISSIYLENLLIDNTEWRFWIKLSFNTSSSNNARVYLVSDVPDIEGNLNGYFLQIGETNDSIALFKQTDSVTQKIISGTIAYTGNSTNVLRIKVTRDNTGIWNLYSDITGGNNFQLEGTIMDNTFTSTSYFGIYCKYTSSNATKFYFDDFYVNNIIIDTIPPEISSLEIISSNELDVVFTESVEQTTAEAVENYSVDNGIGNPIEAIRYSNDHSRALLTFSNNFTDGLTNTLTISNVEDLEGNAISSVSKTFTYYAPYVTNPYDVVINEIMTDYNPAPNNLPETDYLELYNRTSVPINLDGWTIKPRVSSDTLLFPDVTIEPDSFLIIVTTALVQMFEQFGQVAGISGFLLNNEGTVTIRNSNGTLIHTISYTKDWYHNTEKQEGGWSIEQIDPMYPCIGENNWKASIDEKGGTPGTRNSIDAENSINPELSKIKHINNSSIRLYFNQAMDSLSLTNLSAYTINNGIGNPIEVIINSPDNNSVVLNFSSSMQGSIIYTLTITGEIKNCIGILLPLNTSLDFGIPEPAASMDVVINEILFNPRGDDGVDFIEIYNKSNKLIDLKELMLGSIRINIHEPPDTTYKIISEDNHLLFPGDYFVLTKDPEKVKHQYYTSNSDGFIEMSSFPFYNNDEGIAMISNTDEIIIDQFSYTEEMQFPLLNTFEGVSLERINFDRPTQDETNWHSASEDVGFATPAYKNSQYSEQIQVEDPISISPDIFSPDNDGYNDVLNINYQFDTPGYTANITIYDDRGRLVRYLIKNEFLGTEGVFSWDGITDNNEKANIGIYIIYIEVFDLNGSVKHY